MFCNVFAWSLCSWCLLISWFMPMLVGELNWSGWYLPMSSSLMKMWEYLWRISKQREQVSLEKMKMNYCLIVVAFCCILYYNAIHCPFIIKPAVYNNPSSIYIIYMCVCVLLLIMLQEFSCSMICFVRVSIWCSSNSKCWW